MLQNNLSLGMALQGSPKDYSQAVFAMRKKGEEADAKKADDEEKKRAKIMEDVRKLSEGTAKVFPWQQPQVEKLVAETLDVYKNASSSSNPDYSALASTLTRFKSGMSKLDFDYQKQLNLIQNANKFGINPEEGEALLTARTIEEARERTGRTIMIDDNGNISIRAIADYKPVSQSAQDFINNNRSTIFNERSKREEVVNGTKQLFYEIPESVANSYVATVFNNSKLAESAIRDYQEYAVRNGLALPENPAQQLEGAKEYARQTFSDVAKDQMGKVRFGKGATFINNYSPAKDAVDNNFSTSNIEYEEINLEVADEAGNKWNTTTFTVPVMNTRLRDEAVNLSSALDAATGKKVKKLRGNTVKKGQLVLVPTATKDFELEVKEFGRTFSFKKGEIVPKELMATAENIPNIQFEAKDFTVTNEGESIYLPFNSAEQVKMALEETKSTKGLTETIKGKIEDAKKKALEDNIQLNSRMFKNIEDMFGIKRSELLQDKEVAKYDKQNKTIKLDNKGSKPSTTKPKTRVENAKEGLKGF